jgi:outer membrane protein OmpA-like peptidoglycan-associated protein
MSRFWLTKGSAATVALMMLGPAAAQYKADDVVRAFTSPPADLGPSRGLCIGTESECRVKAAPTGRVATPNFDLLITFEYDSDQLTPPAKQNLDEFAAALKNPGLVNKRFVVEGHTDGRGSQEYNLELSQRRASAVVRYLGDRGVGEAHLLARGYGKLRPRAADPLDPMNRRVEARLTE